MGRRSRQIPIAVDQLINTFFGGWADETISSAAWRKRCESKGWALLRKMIDALFFWQTDHCKTAYESELKRRQLPEELR
ncbi:hypothetical protein [Oxalobacter paraformigenes]|uniref:Uncharacterized protein n=1 Tax=Oxalobacter paraformigenes TaxID=556268 RepID=T5LE15_9BURK|nr:hypothetical protein [Oxalobacter paraformigenes]EQM95091.1 hypothetical protein OFAG_02315 [Oxalobacter paraformigenes]